MIQAIDSRRRLVAGAAALVAILLMLQAALVAIPAHASSGTVVAAPSSGTGVENNDYPRIIRLEASADTSRRGDLLTRRLAGRPGRSLLSGRPVGQT